MRFTLYTVTDGGGLVKRAKKDFHPEDWGLSPA